jgi:hypothetical protein
VLAFDALDLVPEALMTDPRFLAAVPQDATDFTDEYELVDFAPEPKRTRNRIAAILAAGFAVACVAGVWAASPTIRNFITS